MKKAILYIVIVLMNLSFACAKESKLPRPEYPRPQLKRLEWINLNGQWTYTFDFGQSGMNRKLYNSQGFENFITVPFCPESKLSGVGYTDFIPAMWYHRSIQIPDSWKGKQVILHFGAIDYYSVIYIDGKVMKRHWGGSSSFDVNITTAVSDGKPHYLVVRVEDNCRSGMQTRGKQSGNYYSQGCEYTRVTGIWQTVWMEPVDQFGIKNLQILPELDKKSFTILPQFYALSAGQQVEAVIKEDDKIVCRRIVNAATPLSIELPLKKIRTWSPESPFLYNIELYIRNKDGKIIDQVTSYAGMRKIHIEGNRLYLNNKPYYLRFVLDQGYYPDGIWTAPTDNDLKRDIELSMAAGFNGARLHQKVFEERYHYWADRLGYLTWGESASWGVSTSSPEAARNFLSEWSEIVERDRNHPSIICWTPFNETWDRPNNIEQAAQHGRLIADTYRLCHLLDNRPVNDASGNYHVITDIWSVHHYAQNGPEMKKRLEPQNGIPTQKDVKMEVRYNGQPYFIDEYGGIKWVSGKQFSQNSWGYGKGPQTLEEFYARLKEITDVILSYKHISGYCYTQLTDVEQEQNGIYNYDRTPKFDMQRIKEIFSQKPY